MKVKPTYPMSVIRAALKTCKEIVFTPGVYMISKPLIFYSNTHIIIEDGAILRQAGKIEHILMSHTTKKTTEYNGTHDVIIEGEGTLEGMGKYNCSLNLLTLFHCQNIRIRGTAFLDTQGFHALEINSSCDVIIEQNTFAGFRSFLGKNEFREAIQIDSATESGLFIHPHGSKCYDGTACKNIVINGNVFAASKSRLAFSRCIGNHSQSERHHIGIEICNNSFIGGNQETVNSPAVSLINMYDVTVDNNKCFRYGRFAKVYRQDYTYDRAGDKIPATKTQGICANVKFTRNSIQEPIGTVKNHKIYVQGKHNNIVT